MSRLLISQDRATLLISIRALVDAFDAEQLAKWYVDLNAFRWPNDCPARPTLIDVEWAAEQFLEAIIRKVDERYLTLHWQAAGNASDRKALEAQAVLAMKSPPVSHVRRDWKPFGGSL